MFSRPHALRKDIIAPSASPRTDEQDPPTLLVSKEGKHEKNKEVAADVPCFDPILGLANVPKCLGHCARSSTAVPLPS